MFTNIHVAPAPEPGTLNPESSLPRLRRVTNDPAREYAQRPGEVEKLPDSIAALILSKQGYSKVTRNGIRVEGVTEKPLTFWCEGSVTIAEKAGTNEKVLWTLNRLKPDVLHVLGKDGEYIESIPLEGKVPWFDEAATQKVLGAKTRANNRRIERVRGLHAADSEAAVSAATANDAALKSIVHTFPVKESRDSHGVPQVRGADGALRSPISPRDRQSTPALSGKERIDPEHSNRAGSLNGQRSNLGEVSADRVIHVAETVELPSRAEGHDSSSARGASSENDECRMTNDESGRFPNADRIHQIQRHLDGQRQSHEDRQQVRRNAARFGAATARVTHPALRIPEPATRTQQPNSEEEIW